MGREPSVFKERDLTRAIRATRKAGVDIARVELDKTGKIVIIAGQPPESTTAAAEGGNEWDEV